jgi:lipocalin
MRTQQSEVDEIKLTKGNFNDNFEGLWYDLKHKKTASWFQYSTGTDVTAKYTRKSDNTYSVVNCYIYNGIKVCSQGDAVFCGTDSYTELNVSFSKIMAFFFGRSNPNYIIKYFLQKGEQKVMIITSDKGTNPAYVWVLASINPNDLNKTLREKIDTILFEQLEVKQEDLVIVSHAL